MAKMYEGKPPIGEDGWMMRARLANQGGVDWGVFVKRQGHSDDWVTCKIAAFGKAEGKANYWLAKNVRTGQIGFARDYAIMRENRPQLHGLVEMVLSEVV